MISRFIHIRRISLSMLVMAGAAGSAAAGRASGGGPRDILDRAITQAGGAQALERARALTWDGEATINGGGRTVRIAGNWAVQAPDTAVVATWDVTRGPQTMRALVVAAPRGWLWSPASFAPMPAAMLASERDEFYLYDVMRLVPLRDADVTLTAIPPDSTGQRGFRAERPGRPAIDLFVDGDGRLSHLRTTIDNAEGGEPVRQDVWLRGTLEAAGIRWPARITILQNGEPFFDLTLSNLRVLDRIDDARLRGP
ncbi:hypothetical protein [Longimicrobium terrae]|uniref:Outer membrane lipoprotein-sorting protein n=1 Tax=Longimicrobium terrae TaxID=1639882 RepID=A0A841H4U8_9BACT|nr:hypothetical protein [Longimicrobium terrae]MBB4639016.1 hypothetical protein [Longimicrobium terrae]MBB6073255.1 hypothetical protein [Longimicrobium terrae]NNC32294.1 hypothetical protein [Longimicrobium terrae]